MINSVIFTKESQNDFARLRKEDLKLCGKLMELIMDAIKDPYQGLGQPEPLKGEGEYWSRRISQKHRMVYCVKDDVIEIVRCYGHYSDK
jgi:toxin YoeB